jgi:hypothetical protein
MRDEKNLRIPIFVLVAAVMFRATRLLLRPALAGGMFVSLFPLTATSGFV